MANRNPYALRFNGSTYIRTTNGISNVSSVATISFWATFDNTSWKGTQIGFAGVYNLFYNNVSGLDVFGFNTWNNDVYGILNASTKLADGNPHHIVAEFNPSNVTLNKLWIDGVRQTLSQVWGTPSSGNASLNNNLWIGCGNSTSDQMHKGIIDEITVWNRTLSESEINSLKWITGNENGLVGYFKMDDGSGNQITNFLTGNKYTITGTPIWVNGIIDLGVNKILIQLNNGEYKSIVYDTTNKIKTILSPTEQDYINHGMDKTVILDFSVPLQQKSFIKKNITTIGSGKVFSKTIDTTQLPIKKLTIK